MNDIEKMFWKGKEISSMSRDELLAVVEDLARQLKRANDNTEKSLGLMQHFMVKRR